MGSTRLRRSARAVYGAALAVIALTVAPGCKSYNDRVAVSVGAFEQGDFDRAEAAFQDTETTGSSFLSGAEAGMAAFAAGRFDGALNHFGRALTAAKDIEERAAIGASNLTQSLLSLTVNESQADYAGEGYERVMLHVMLALSYLGQIKPTDVLVEAKIVDQLLTTEEELYESSYGAGGMGHLLSAVAYELVGKSGEAYIDYKRMHEKGVGGELVQSALLRLGGRLGRGDDLARWQSEFGSSIETPPPTWPSVVLIAGIGMGPAKREFKLDVPVKGGVFSMAVPKFDDGGAGRGQSLQLSFPESGTTVNSSVVENVAAVAKENLDDRIAWITARSVGRGLLKRQLADQMRDNKRGGLLGLAADAFTVVTERADLRAWRTLPQLWVAARAFVPPDEFVDIELREAGGGTVSLGRFRLNEGETMFVLARSLQSGLTAHVVGGERESSVATPSEPSSAPSAPNGDPTAEQETAPLSGASTP